MRNFLEELKNVDHLFGFDPSVIDQGTPEWFALRWGVFTASNAKHLFQCKRGSKGIEYGTDYLPIAPSATGRKAYMADLVAEVALPRVPDEINAKPLLWGKDHEDEARDAYEALTFNSVREVPFVYSDTSMRSGSSPDGIVDSMRGGLELKCPWSPSVFIQFATQDKLKNEERHQCQFNMYATGLDVWHAAKFDPRMINCKKLHMIEVKRCPTAMQIIADGLGSFTEEMDLMLDKLDMKFGDQWLKG